MAHETRERQDPDIYDRMLCEHIGSGEEGGSQFAPIGDYKDENGKIHRYNNPQRHLTAYSADGYVVDVRWSEDYAADDPVSALVRVVSANLRPDVREPIKNWEVTGVFSRLGRMTVMLEANDAPDLRIAEPGERPRPGAVLSTMLKGHMQNLFSIVKEVYCGPAGGWHTALGASRRFDRSSESACRGKPAQRG